MAEEESKPIENSNHICKSCAHWKEFSNKCWFYWDEKKECSQHRVSFTDEVKLMKSDNNSEEMEIIRLLEELQR